MAAERNFNAHVASLHDAKARFDALRGHFDRLVVQAKRLADEAESPLRGTVTVAEDNGALVLKILERSLRISFRFDRQAYHGVIHVQDETAADRPRSHNAIEHLPFNGVGETSIAGGLHGGNLLLTVPGDCMTLLARILDNALNNDPWAE